MSDWLNSNHETLLGRLLLGEATSDEIEELEQERGKNPGLATLMATLEKTSPTFHETSIGTKGPLERSNATLPSYRRPAELANIWRIDTARVWLTAAVGLPPALVTLLTAPENLLATLVSCLLIVLIGGYVVLGLHHARQADRQAKRVGAEERSWRSMVGKSRGFESLATSPWFELSWMTGVGLVLLGVTSFAFLVTSVAEHEIFATLLGFSCTGVGIYLLRGTVAARARIRLSRHRSSGPR